MLSTVKYIQDVYYKLDENNEVVACDYKDYCHWHSGLPIERKLSFGFMMVAVWIDPDGIFEVSTTMFGRDLEYRLGVNPKPVVFETMIFGYKGWETNYQERCSTYKEAIDMHNEAIAYVMEIRGSSSKREPANERDLCQKVANCGIS